MSDGPKPADDPERLLQTMARAEGSPSSGEVKVLFNSRADPVVGSEVLGYVVKGKIGQGGMGLVYEGEQPTIGKRVAIKVLRPEIAENPEQMRRLVAEARAVNAVGHRGIVDVFGYGQLTDGRQCIVMEFLEGEPLADLLLRNEKEHHGMPLLEALVILEEVLSALSAAHGAGVIHRDLKPTNIFLCRQRDGSRYVKLLDFGIAKVNAGDSAPQTNPSITVGTPSYMAPEQAAGKKASPAMDLYAMGVIAFEMITGRLPFTGSSVIEVLMKHAEEKPVRPSSLLMSIPDDVDEIVLKLLEKEPKDRYQTAEEVRVDIVRARKVLSESTVRPALSEAEPPKGVGSLMDDQSGAITARGYEVIKDPEPSVPPPGPAAPDDETIRPTSRSSRKLEPPKPRFEPPKATGTSRSRPDLSREKPEPGRSSPAPRPIERDGDATLVPRKRVRELEAAAQAAPKKLRGIYLGAAGLVLGVAALLVAVVSNRSHQDSVVVVEELPPPIAPAAAEALQARLKAAEAKLLAQKAGDDDPRLKRVRELMQKLAQGALDANGQKDAERVLSELGAGSK